MIFLFSFTSTFGLSSSVLASNNTSDSNESSTPASKYTLTKENDLNIKALENRDSNQYVSKPVEMGSIKIQNEIEPTIYYPTYDVVSPAAELGTVTIKKMLVVYGQMVKKGQPVAEISTDIDEVYLKQQTLELARVKGEYSRLIQNQTKILKEQKQALEEITNKQDKKIASLEYEKAVLNYGILKRNQEKEISLVEKEIKKLEEIKNTTKLFSPRDGFVVSAATFNTGEKIDSTTGLAKIVDPNDICLSVSDRELNYVYNMDVNLTLTNKDSGKTKKFKGKVLTSLKIFSGLESKISCFIKPDIKINQEEINDQRLTGIVDICIMENVLVAPYEMVTFKEGSTSGYSVASTYELVDGALKERKFFCGLYDSKYYQVIDGLDKGLNLARKQ